MPSAPKQPHVRHRHFLREWRGKRGYTQVQAAEMIGCSQGLLSRIENQKTPYDQDFLEIAAEVYGTDTASLVMRDPSLGSPMWTVWEAATPYQREQIVAIAKTLLKTGS
jgi:transcriptional regulator with XRE-family HTH domain